jgi:uridylate kinase
MDLSAIDIAKNNNLVLKVANLFKPGAMMRVVVGEKE